MILVIIGALFIFVIPGLLITLNYFNETKTLEKIALTVILSIVFVVFIGILLGFNEFTFKLTGGLTKTNLWVIYLVVCVGLLGRLFWVRKFDKI